MTKMKIQYDNGGTIEGCDNFTFDPDTKTLSVFIETAGPNYAELFNFADSPLPLVQQLWRARGTKEAPEPVQVNDYLAAIYVGAFVGSDYQNNWGIDWSVDGFDEDGNPTVATAIYGPGGAVSLWLAGKGDATFGFGVNPGPVAGAAIPAWSPEIEGRVVYNKALHKLQVAGAAGWETISSV